MAGCIAAVVLAGPGFAQLPCSYELAAVIQAPPGPFGTPTSTRASAISPNGRYVVGSYQGPFDDYARGFWYDMQTGQFNNLPWPTGVYQSSCNDVSDAGLIVGSYWKSGGVAPQRGYVFDLNSNQFIAELMPLPGASWAAATGINASGQVCGWRSIGSKGDPVNPTTAFIWSAPAGFTDLGVIDGRATEAAGINNAGLTSISTGFSADAGSLAYLWSGRRPTPIGFVPGGLSSGIGRINSEGWVIVGGLLQQSPLQLAAFIRRPDGAFLRLLPLSGDFSAGLRSINRMGVVGGQSNSGLTSPIVRTACLWRQGQVTTLASMIVGDPGGTLTSALVSDSHVIAAEGYGGPNGNASMVFVYTPQFGRSGDTNCDQQINVTDLLHVLSAWGPCGGCSADLNGDSAVEVFDLVEVIMNWGSKGGGA